MFLSLNARTLLKLGHLGLGDFLECREELSGLAGAILEALSVWVVG